MSHLRLVATEPVVKSRPVMVKVSDQHANHASLKPLTRNEYKRAAHKRSNQAFKQAIRDLDYEADGLY